MSSGAENQVNIFAQNIAFVVHNKLAILFAIFQIISSKFSFGIFLLLNFFDPDRYIRHQHLGDLAYDSISFKQNKDDVFQKYMYQQALHIFIIQDR